MQRSPCVTVVIPHAEGADPAESGRRCHSWAGMAEASVLTAPVMRYEAGNDLLHYNTHRGAQLPPAGGSDLERREGHILGS